jgi:hypothetical protein
MDIKRVPMAEQVVKVTVTIEAREDGGLYIYSNDVPGFVLSHLDAHAVLADIEPALSVFLSQKLDRAVVATQVASLRESLIKDGVIDAVPRGMTTREYVALAA